ncbi:MAG: PAS domain S-box protein [Deltaproteobacteria bacterium]|nr:PAS domain S-box protein [Deltaproteobacteria bacterium]
MTKKKTYEELEVGFREDQNIYDLLDNAPKGIFLIDLSGKILFANRMGANRLGKEPREIIGTALREYFSPDIAEKRRIKGIEAVKSGNPQTIEDYIEDRWYYSTIYPIMNKDGDQTKLAIYSEDITDRKKAEAAVRSERERFRSLSENAPFGMVMIAEDGTFKYINPKFIELFGYDLNDIPDGRTWFRKAYPDSDYRRRVVSAWLEDLASTKVGQKRPRVFQVQCKDGSKKIVNFIPVQLVTGENLMACEDITERKEAELALRKSEIRFRELFNSVSDLVYTHDLHGRLLSMNAALCRTFGYSRTFGYNRKELLGRRISAFMKPEFADAFEGEYLNKIQKEEYCEGTTAYFTKDGSQIYLEYRSSMVYPEEGEPYITGIGRDVTSRIQSEKEKRKLQAQLQQAQKMESIGILAGGIAHNFNNILMGIQGRASIMMMEKENADPDYEHLKGIESYVKNAVMLTRDLLGFRERRQV